MFLSQNGTRHLRPADKRPNISTKRFYGRETVQRPCDLFRIRNRGGGAVFERRGRNGLCYETCLISDERFLKGLAFRARPFRSSYS